MATSTLSLKPLPGGAPRCNLLSELQLSNARSEIAILVGGRDSLELTQATMPITDHNLFEQPPEHAKLWRYMDVSKLVSLLATRTLFFPRADPSMIPGRGQFHPMMSLPGRRWLTETQTVRRVEKRSSGITAAHSRDSGGTLISPAGTKMMASLLQCGSCT
jgi:hypothetical protein